MAEASRRDAFNDVKKETKAIDTSRKLKVAIIGTGWIADSHIVEYKKMPDIELVALADLVDGKAKAFADKWELPDARIYSSHKELIDNEKDIDLVSICTYNRTHAECAIYALDHGINVILEKPMCVTLDEAAEIMRAEKRSGKLLSIGFQPRFDPNMKQVREVVQSGVLGKIYYIQTGGGRRAGIPFPFGTTFLEQKTAGIGAMGDIGCYSLDMVLNAIGYPKPLTVSGYTSDFFGKNPNYSGYVKSDHSDYSKLFNVEDFAAAFVRLEGDIILDFRISWAMHMDTAGDTLILGTEGGLKIPSAECWSGSIGGPMKIFHSIGGNLVETEIPLVTEQEHAFYDKIRSMVDAIKDGGTAPIPTSQILYNQAIIDGIIRSAKEKKELTIELPEI